MLASIRVIDLVVDQIEGQSKLNQHKSDEDHVVVANQLARAEETGRRRLAKTMRALRPELPYEAVDGVTGRPPARYGAIWKRARERPIGCKVVVPQTDGVNNRSRACPLQASSRDDHELLCRN